MVYNYFVNYEIIKKKEAELMVIMNLELENILGFPNFKMNFSYPKKIVSSIIEGEHLAGRPNFRYKKAIVLMGANAAGKTEVLEKNLDEDLFPFINSGNPSFLFEIVSKRKCRFVQYRFYK